MAVGRQGEGIKFLKKSGDEDVTNREFPYYKGRKVKFKMDYSMAKRIRKNGTAMMGRVPVLKYNEIGDIMCLEHRNHLNGVVVG